MTRAKILGFLSAFAVAIGIASQAHAADDATHEAYPLEMTKRPIQLPEGMLQVRGDVGIDLSTGIAGKRIIVAPSAHYGVTKDLQLGLEHGNASGGQSLCFGSFCDVYNGFSVDGKYWLVRNEGFSLSAHLALPVSQLSPNFFLSARAGVYIWWYATENFALWADPALVIGIIGRDKGNKEVLDIPIRAAYNVTPELALYAETGFTTPLEFFGDLFRIPLGVGALYAINHKIDVGGQFTFTQLLGGSLVATGVDGRYLGAFANFRF